MSFFRIKRSRKTIKEASDVRFGHFARVINMKMSLYKKIPGLRFRSYTAISLVLSPGALRLETFFSYRVTQIFTYELNHPV